MDLARVPNKRKLELCMWYFKVGFALLPFAWTVNVFWFFEDAFLKPTFEEQKSIKKYVAWSAVGSLVWLAVLTAWIVTFQTNRTKWGELGDDLSIMIPLGSE